MNKDYFVYILKSLSDNRFYTGMTDNLNRRIKQHNRGNVGTLSTYGRGPFQLIHVEITSSRIEARLLEKFFKTGTGREIREEIINGGCSSVVEH